MHRYDPLFTLQKGVHVYLLSIPAVSLPSFAMQEVSICAFKFIQNREMDWYTSPVTKRVAQIGVHQHQHHFKKKVKVWQSSGLRLDFKDGFIETFSSAS